VAQRTSGSLCEILTYFSVDVPRRVGGVDITIMFDLNSGICPQKGSHEAAFCLGAGKRGRGGGDRTFSY